MSIEHIRNRQSAGRSVSQHVHTFTDAAADTPQVRALITTAAAARM
jgi:hypothetical protein